MQGNEFIYIYVCIFLCFIPIICAAAGYSVVKLQNRRRRRLKIKQEELKKGSDAKGPVDKMFVREWLHANHKRNVKVKFGPEIALYTINRKGEKMRTINFKNVDTIHVEESDETRHKKKPLILLQAPQDYDLVLEYDTIASRRKFLAKLETFLHSHKKHLKITRVSNFNLQKPLTPVTMELFFLAIT